MFPHLLDQFAAIATDATSWSLGGIVAAMLDQALAIAQGAIEDVRAWIVDGYRRRPVVIVGLAGLLLVPVLAILGQALHRRRFSAPAPPAAFHDAPAAANAAWIEFDGADPIELREDRELLQIGREGDNDVCLPDTSVHRYHAVIERRRYQGFYITDVSGPDGNGVRVNGERRAIASLTDGDIVELGKARFRFATAA